MNLNARLNQLEKLAAERKQKLKAQQEQEQQAAAIARFEAMDQTELIAEYNAAINEPLPPELAAKLATMDTNQLINFYFGVIKND